MRLLYTLYKDSFPTRNFKGGKDLNDSCEYPYYPNKGMWLSPVIETETGVTSVWDLEKESDDDIDIAPTKIYTLKEDAKLFHFRSVADYTRAYGTFPLFMKKKEYIYTQYVDKSEYFSNEIAKWMDIYSKFSTWKNEFSNADLASNTLKEPLCFTDAKDNIIRLIASEDTDGSLIFQDDSLEAITGYMGSKDAIVRLKQVCDYIIRNIKKMSKCISPSPDDTIIGIDYNAMRSAGYKGIYIHKSAVEEARSVKEGSPLYEIIDPLLFWAGETVCVWKYCFAE
jgi:hypothetical protein